MRHVLLILGSLVMVGVTGCGSGAESGVVDGPSDGTARQPVQSFPVESVGPIGGTSLVGLPLSTPVTSSIVVSGDRVVVVDGLHQLENGRFTTRAWIAPLDDPSRGTAFDLSVLGPRGGVDVEPRDGSLWITGVPCDAIVDFDGMVDASFQEVCGSTSWDVFTLDTDDMTIDHRVGPLDLAPAEMVWFLASTERQLLMKVGDTVQLIERGAVRSIQDMPAATYPVPQGEVVCAIGDRFYAAHVVGDGVRDGVERPIQQFLSASLLEDEAWKPVEITPPGSSAQALFLPGCTEDGIVATTSQVTMDGLDLVSSDPGAHVIAPIGVSETPLDLTTLPVDDLPPSANKARGIRMAGFDIVVSVMRSDGTSDTYRWSDSNWQPVLEGAPSEEYISALTAMDAVIIQDGTAMLRRADRPFSYWEDSFGGPTTHVELVQ